MYACTVAYTGQVIFTRYQKTRPCLSGQVVYCREYLSSLDDLDDVSELGNVAEDDGDLLKDLAGVDRLHPGLQLVCNLLGLDMNSHDGFWREVFGYYDHSW